MLIIIIIHSILFYYLKVEQKQAFELKQVPKNLKVIKTIIITLIKLKIIKKIMNE